MSLVERGRGGRGDGRAALAQGADGIGPRERFVCVSRQNLGVHWKKFTRATFTRGVLRVVPRSHLGLSHSTVTLSDILNNIHILDDLFLSLCLSKIK